MLQNETYIGNMVQGRSKKVSYKSKKTIRQPRSDWIIVPGTHAPIIDAETFTQAGRLLAGRRHTRARTYDFLLKGLIYCHECGYPLAVLNRKNAAGEDCLYFVCRTYQRFTKAGVCTCHCIKAETVTQAVLEKVRAICEPYLKAETLGPLAKRALAETGQALGREQDRALLQSKIDSLSSHLDKIYQDRLTGILEEQDFARIYPRIKEERARLAQRLAAFNAPEPSPEQQAEAPVALARRFIGSACSSRALLISLIERVELTEDKRVILRFRCPRPEAFA